MVRRALRRCSEQSSRCCVEDVLGVVDVGSLVDKETGSREAERRDRSCRNERCELRKRRKQKDNAEMKVNNKGRRRWPETT